MGESIGYPWDIVNPRKLEHELRMIDGLRFRAYFTGMGIMMSQLSGFYP